jgi:hypothetical protein
MRASPIPVQGRLPIPVSQAGSTDSSSARCSLSDTGIAMITFKQLIAAALLFTTASALTPSA